jgi:hypothetical protein
MADIWFVCKVESAGPDENGNVLVRLSTQKASPSGVTFGPLWFIAVEISKREMLATALSAIATGLNVDAMFRPPTEVPVEGGTLYRLYVRSLGEV